MHGIMVTTQGGEERETGGKKKKHTSILIRPELRLLSLPSNFCDVLFKQAAAITVCMFMGREVYLKAKKNKINIEVVLLAC